MMSAREKILLIAAAILLVVAISPQIYAFDDTLPGGGGAFSGGDVTESITFSGTDPDVTTGTNEDFEIDPNGAGVIRAGSLVKGDGAPLNLGFAATSDRGFSANENVTHVGSVLEVDQQGYFDAGLTVDEEVEFQFFSGAYRQVCVMHPDPNSTGLKILLDSTYSHNNVIVGSTAYQSQDSSLWSATSTDPTLWIVSADSPSSFPNRNISMRHNSTNAEYNVNEGDLVMSIAGGDIVTDASLTGATGNVSIGGDCTPNYAGSAVDDLCASGEIEVKSHLRVVGNIHNYNASVYHIRGLPTEAALVYGQLDDGLHIFPNAANDSTNNHIIIGPLLHKLKDFGHDTPSADPELILHARTDPDLDTTKYAALSHDTNNFVIRTGSGNVDIQTSYHTYFGQMAYNKDQASGATTDTTMTAQSTYYEVDGLTDVGLNNGVSISSGDITVTNAGVYRLCMSVSASVDAINQEIDMSISINNVIQNHCSAHRYFSSTNIGNAGSCCILDLSASDVVKLEVENNTSAGKVFSTHGAQVVIQQM